MAQFNRILLVEDDVDIQENLRTYLELEGFSVDSAFNGKEAFAFLEKMESGKEPSVILLDLMMPVMTGYEFLGKIRLENSFPSIPIIVLSAAPDLEQAARARVARFIRKPFTLESLVTTIREVRKASQPLPPG